MPTHFDLRSRTAAAHEAVDAAFAHFDLGERRSYTGFLAAHARAVSAIETALSLAGETGWRARTPLVAADLATLGQAVPKPLRFEAPADEAAVMGILYVMEGSRLGGGMLAKRVGEGLPVAYLSAVHLPGEWRAFRDRLDRLGEAGGPDWTARAERGAMSAFDLYKHAAAETAAV